MCKRCILCGMLNLSRTVHCMHNTIWGNYQLLCNIRTFRYIRTMFHKRVKLEWLCFTCNYFLHSKFVIVKIYCIYISHLYLHREMIPYMSVPVPGKVTGNCWIYCDIWTKTYDLYRYLIFAVGRKDSSSLACRVYSYPKAYCEGSCHWIPCKPVV